jgi:hypothetical protein
LVLARLTNIRWMNDTAEVHHRLEKTGRLSSFAVFVHLLGALEREEAAATAALLVNWLFVHLNFYPVKGLGHQNDRIDFITNRLLFSEILMPWLQGIGSEGLKAIAKKRSARGRSILAALRNGFLQEAQAAPENEGLSGRLAGIFAGRRSSARDLPSPIRLHPELVPALLLPLVDGPNRTIEALHYGLGRSIDDGREYLSLSLLEKNLGELERQCERWAPEAGARMPWKAILGNARAAAAALEGAEPVWKDLPERDRGYVTPDELLLAAFIVLPPDWRARVAPG